VRRCSTAANCSSIFCFERAAAASISGAAAEQGDRDRARQRERPGPPARHVAEMAGQEDG